MNIILLSGGSGKRLWPLSNDIRSKQFIKIFDNSFGVKESMLERVYRQIKSADIDAIITIATESRQVSAIRNQLSDAVSLSIEPTRRDTFPAIALAVAYLRYELAFANDDIVIVCPVDPYVDDGYFKSLKKLEDIISENNVNLALMGIEPTYPSQKYGYIIPQTNERISKVRYFKEKPDENAAKQYINMGALWNAGIFAFRLSYILNKTREIIDFKDYNDLRSKYSYLPKISFDYSVVEKEENIQVLRYKGDWKDVGTWNTITETMTDNINGKAIMSNTSRNTHIINELNIPILAIGCKDMVIAASTDGILISDKYESAFMKPYVDEIKGEVRYAEKSWGTYKVIDIQTNAMTISIDLKTDCMMSYHSHKNREEVLTVLSGVGSVIIDGVETAVTSGVTIKIPKEAKHTLIAKSDIKAVEIQIGEELSRYDKTKYPLKLQSAY